MCTGVTIACNNNYMQLSMFIALVCALRTFGSVFFFFVWREEEKSFIGTTEPESVVVWESSNQVYPLKNLPALLQRPGTTSTKFIGQALLSSGPFFPGD